MKVAFGEEEENEKKRNDFVTTFFCGHVFFP